MESLGKRKIDELGRVTLPVEFRKEHGWGEGDTVSIYRVEDTLMFRQSEKHQQPACIFCNKPESKLRIGTSDICCECLEVIKVGMKKVWL